jgi:hypothetical protein
MAIVSAPSALMTVTAAALIQAAYDLGLPADVVATTGDTPLGLGFEVPEEVYRKWLESTGTTVTVSEPEPEVPAEPEPVETPEPKVPKKRGPGKPVTDGPEV